RGLDLVGNDLRLDRDEPVVPVVGRVEGDDAGQGAHTVGAEGLEGLQVHLDPGATGGFGSSDYIGKCSHPPTVRRRRVTALGRTRTPGLTARERPGLAEREGPGRPERERPGTPRAHHTRAPRAGRTRTPSLSE